MNQKIKNGHILTCKRSRQIPGAVIFSLGVQACDVYIPRRETPLCDGDATPQPKSVRHSPPEKAQRCDNNCTRPAFKMPGNTHGNSYVPANGARQTTDLTRILSTLEHYVLCCYTVIIITIII